MLTLIGVIGLSGCNGAIGGGSDVPTVIPPAGPGVTETFDLPNEASPLHRCAVAPLLEGNRVGLVYRLQPQDARARVNSSIADFNNYTAITQNIRKTVAERFNAAPKAVPDPWTGLARSESASILDLLRLSIEFAAFRTGRADYTAEMSPMTDRLQAGDMIAASEYLAATAASATQTGGSAPALADSIGTLGLLERGTVNLASGDIACARAFFDQAVEQLRTDDARKNYADQIWDRLSDDYAATGFETVMAVNYKAITDFLDGDPRIDNNIRLARAWQARERQRYQEELAEAKAEARRDEPQEREGASAEINLRSTFSSQFNDACLSCAEIASRVETPYVNPLADFLSAARSEHLAERARLSNDSMNYTSALSNALVAYKNAQSLRHDNTTVAQAVKELGRDDRQLSRDGANAVMAGRGGRLVHLVMDVGRAPERRVAKLILPTSLTTFVQLQVPYYQPVAKQVDTVRIESATGDVLGEIQPLADVEAMLMRTFQDELPLHLGKATASAVGTYFLQLQARKVGGEGAFGELLRSTAANITSMAAAKVTEPGTESWISLPYAVGVGRLRLPADAHELRLVSYDAEGRRLASDRVTLGESGPAFVYARGVGNHLVAQASRPPAADRRDGEPDSGRTAEVSYEGDSL